MENRTLDIRTVWPVALLSGCFLLGGVLGCLFAITSSGGSATQLGEYLTDCMSLFKSGVSAPSVLRTFWGQGRWFILCTLLGLAGAGVAVLPVFFALRGFLLSFGVACFVRFLGLPGFLPACVLFGIPALLWMPGLFLSGVLSYRAARAKIGASPVMSGMGRGYRVGLLLSAFLFLLCVFVECSLLPVLLPVAARSLG